jgi:dihydroorotate dehydrogenase
MRNPEAILHALRRNLIPVCSLGHQLGKRGRMSVYESLVRPALFCLPPDLTHAIGHLALRPALPWRMLATAASLEVDDPVLKTTFAGIDLASPVGLAAGFDKDCELIGALSVLGFGFLTVGSIMPQPRPGHPYPRLVRYTETGSLADSMGLPSRGRDYCVARLAQLGRRRVPVFANIGGFSAEEIAASLFAVEPHVDAIEISLMCPNMPRAGERFDDVGLLRDILARTQNRRKRTIVRVPNDTARSEHLAELIECCIEGGIDIKVAGGRPVSEPRLGMKQGTLHGRAVFDTALENVTRAAKLARGRIPIKANGGIRSGEDALAMLRAGATCVDLYSAFIYQGWSVARRINTELAALLRQQHAAVYPPDAVAGARPAGA